MHNAKCIFLVHSCVLFSLFLIGLNFDEFVIVEKVIKELSKKLTESEAQITSALQVGVASTQL